MSAPRFADLLPAPPEVSAAWHTFSLQVVEAPLHATAEFADHALGLYIVGRHRIRRELGGRSVEGWSDRGTVNFTPCNIKGTWAASGASRAIVLFIPDAYLSRVLAEHWEADPRNVEMVPQFLARDPVIESVMTDLAREARHGSPSGQLWAESACEFLAHHIIRAYSSLSTPPPRSSGGLPGRRLNAVLEYIDCCLAQRIALRQLVTLAGVSARHFERAFREAVGVPPHAYVLGKRLAAARELLVNQPELSISDVASRVGFSSSSHLASAFRRQTGCSPTTFRRLNM